MTFLICVTLPWRPLQSEAQHGDILRKDPTASCHSGLSGSSLIWISGLLTTEYKPFGLAFNEIPFTLPV